MVLHRRLLCLAVAGFVTAAQAVEYGPNRVANDSFEAAGAPAESWAWGSADAAKATAVADEAAAHSGRRSLRLHSELPLRPHVFGGLSQRIAGLAPGSEYVIALWAKGRGVGVCWFGGGPAWSSRATFPTGTYDWTRLELRWRAPETVTEYELRVNVDSQTEALWIDDVSFREVDPLGVKPRVTALGANTWRAGCLLLAPAEPAPRIDGDLADWPAAARPLRLPQEAGVVALERQGDDDLSVALRLAVDSRCLYVGLTVRDNVHWAPPGAPAWTNDSVQVSFDPQRERTPGGYGPRDSEYSLMLGNDGRAEVQCWQAPQGLGDQSRSIAFAAKRTGQTTVYEAAVPWTAIGVRTGDGGPALGLNVLVNDNDGQGRRGYLELTPGIGKTKDPSAYLLALSAAPGSVAVQPSRPHADRDDAVDLTAVVVLGPPLPAAAVVELAAVDGGGQARPLASAPLAAGTGGVVQVACRLPAGTLPLTCTQVRVRVVQSGGQLVASGAAPLLVRDLKQRLGRQVAALRDRAAAVQRLAEQAEAQGLATDYERVGLTTAQEFMDYALDDLAHDRAARAEHVVAVIEATLSATERTLRAYLAGEAKPLLVPRYQTGRVEVRDGAFWADTVVPSTGRRERRPVFFIGYGHFGSVVRDLPKLPRLGANLIQIECGPSSTQPAEGVVTDRPVREFIGKALALGEQHHVMVVYLASPHYFPGWALAKWPELTKGGGGFFGLAVDAPQARRIFRTHLATSLAAIQASPALHSVCLSNEPTFTNWQQDPFRRAAFTEWLAQRFGTIERLNTAWGTRYAAFAEVPIRPTDGLPGEDAMTPLRYEMARFNMQAFSQYHRAMSDVVHATRPGTWTHAKVMCVPADRQNLAWGCDPEQFAALGDLNGNDCWNMFAGYGDQYAAAWMAQNVYYDLQWSLRQVPVSNTEDHIILDREQRLIPPRHTDFALWQGAVHGRGASTVWVWERTYDRTHDFEGSILHRPENVMAVGRVGLDLQRLAPEVVRLQQARAPIAILYSLTAQLWSERAHAAMLTAYEALNACGVPVRFVSEQQAAGGRLKDFAAVIAPAVRHAPDALVGSVTEYCRGGGQLWVVGDEPPFTRDECNRPRQVSLPAGTVRRFPGRLGPQELWRMFLLQLHRQRLRGPVTVSGPNGAAPWAVEYRAVPESGGALVAIANLWGRSQTVRLSLGGQAATRLTDLRAATEIQGDELTLQPLEATLLRVE